MEFIETKIFTKKIKKLLDDKTYQELRDYITEYPLKGVLLKGGGGIRKIRWNKKNTGKSGGVRIIYFIKHKDTVYMLYAFGKNEQENLSDKQVATLAKYVKELKNE